MNNLSLKGKLSLLVGLAIVALLCVAGMGLYGMNTGTNAVHEIGENRLPSVEGLQIINEGQTAVRSNNLSTAIYENDYQAQAKFGEVLAKRKETWARIDKGWKVYDALPQDAEEAKLWKAFEPDWATWKAADAKVGETIAALAANKSEAEQKKLFTTFYKQLEDNAANFKKAEDGLGKVIDHNVSMGEKEVKSAVAAMSLARNITWGVSIAAVLLLLGFSLFMVRSIFKQLGADPAAVAEVANKVAAGDLSMNIQLAQGDATSLMACMKSMQGSVQALVTDAAMLAEAAVAGKLATRADASKHQGDFNRVVAGVNHTLDAVIGPLNVAASYVDQISKGAIPAKITDSYNGDFNTLKNNLNMAIDAINALVADANALAKAAVEGKLETRADAARHQGDFRKIVEGVNNTLDAVIGPLNVAASYVDQISKGAIPKKITDSYNGDFNTLKNNLNMAIDAINALVADAKMLAKAAVEGKLETRADASKHQGDFQAIVKGVNDTLDAVIGPLNVAANYVDQISRGAIPEKISDSYNG
ncbi:MAG: MCP four helix bundle domain-containing protein, partial [Proteobacteria bacterium]|nr:MCP four helix bundle domain-containing protein [Pseudomonadota bacterium]